MVPTLRSRPLTQSYQFLDVLSRTSTDRSTIVRKTGASFLIKNIAKYQHELIPFAKRFVWEYSLEQTRSVLDSLGQDQDRQGIPD